MSRCVILMGIHYADSDSADNNILDEWETPTVLKYAYTFLSQPTLVGSHRTPLVDHLFVSTTFLLANRLAATRNYKHLR